MTSVAVTQTERRAYLQAFQDEREARAIVQVVEKELEYRKGVHRKTRSHLLNLGTLAEDEVSAGEAEEIQQNTSRAIAGFEQILESLGSKSDGTAQETTRGNRNAAMRRARRVKLSRRRVRSHLRGEVPSPEPRSGSTAGHDSILTRDTDTGELRVYDVINGEG
jgi:hypothetical protein